MEGFDSERVVARLEAQLQEAPAAAPHLEAALRALRRPAAPAPDDVRTPAALARRIDHTQLRPEATEGQIRALCAEALRYRFAAVCVNPCYVPLAAEVLQGEAVKVCTVAGFPLGASRPATKAAEARQAIREGADEVDMVMAIGLLKSGRYEAVEDEMRVVVDAARETAPHALVKVILETALLTEVEKAVACVLARRAGAAFVKTSTGFASGGATAEDVALMRYVVGAEMGVKAAGGVRTFAEARRLIAHGATRLGASGSVALMEGAEAESGY